MKKPITMNDPQQRGIENAIIRLLKRRPFYGHMLLGLHRRPSNAPAPVGITLSGGVPTLSVNAERLRAYRGEEQEALLEHLIKHLLHMHMVRRRDCHRLLWDVATDLAINPGIEHMPAAAPRPEKFGLEPGLAAEEYARQLSSPLDMGNLEGEGLGSASREEAGTLAGSDADSKDTPQATPVDDHEIWREADATPVKLAEQTVRDLVRQAWRKSSGEVPGDVSPLVLSMLAPSPVPWRQVLRQFVATAGRVGRRATWMRENRRFGHQTPGQRKRHRLNLLVAVDVSDSTNIQALRETFAAELVRIARGRDSLITVLYAGSRIQKITHFRGTDVVAEVYHGGGFTDLRPAFDYARSMHPRPAAVIYLTDGYGEAPEKMEFPTLWVLTREGQKPADWGVELRLDA
ncbi:vWA domain-containing protein [Geoalkalibacter subterraneus]|nr:VWA-like domain-containing protein [Geoalkalibacter subterraneus]